MADFLSDDISNKAKIKKDVFLKKLESDMHYTSDFSGDLTTFDWVDEIEQACPFIDNVVRRPKLALIQEENTVKIEKSKRITVASIKDLSRHTNYIAKINKKTDEVQPSKILDIRNEETYNIYENRFLYTLIHNITVFLMKKEELLKNFELSDNKLLEYAATSETDMEKVNIEVKVTSESFPMSKVDKKLQDELRSIKERIKRIKEYLTSWQKSEMVKALDKAHIAYINPPIKKTNIIIKNPNFQIAVKLWDFLQKYDYMDNNNNKDNIDTNKDTLKCFLDHSFLLDYFVLDSMSTSKKEQKEKMSRYAVLMISEEIRRTISLLLDTGIEITDEELLAMIAKQIKDEKNNRLVGIDDVKKKFKSAMEEYMERTQNYL